MNKTAWWNAAVLLGAFATSWALTGSFRRHAISRSYLDVPNARSSHSIAVPRGGGVAIVLSTLTTLVILGVTGQLAWTTVVSLCAGGAVTAIIGFIDDRGHVAPRWRLLAHVSAATLVLVTLGGAPPISAMGFLIAPRWWGAVLATLYLVWMLNLTNFMDGIDGIAGVEAITVCLGALVVSEVAVPDARLWLAPLVLAVATLGFLMWNWPPAKIFMGDAGSGFLGIVLATLSLQAGWVVNRLFWSWIILLGVFVVDATLTLVRRMAKGDRFYEAHRSHAYQHAALRHRSHKPITLAVGLINCCWLLPMALIVALGRLDGLLGVVIAYLPIAIIAGRFNAGIAPPV